jgi:hypothetical protein
MNRKTLLLTSISFLILFVFACNLPNTAPRKAEGLIFTQAAETVAAAIPTQSPANATPQPTGNIIAATSTQQPTSTQQATATNTSVPCNLASFVEDVTTPDDTVITVNNGFTKTWRLKNVGSCAWTSGYQLVFESGDQMGGPASQQLTNGSVAPGQKLEVSVNLTAPAAPGTYKGNWKLREPGGTIFGLSTGPFWVQIKAAAVAQAGWPTFKSGKSGPEVFAIQYLLIARGYNLNADGIFGPITQAKVEDFQTDNNLTEDAIVGPETWQALIIQVKQGKSGPEVRAVQKLLKDKFGYNINVDGIFGPATNTAVKSFQSANGLAMDGIVGPKTWQKLISK